MEASSFLKRHAKHNSMIPYTTFSHRHLLPPNQHIVIQQQNHLTKNKLSRVISSQGPFKIWAVLLEAVSFERIIDPRHPGPGAKG